MEENGDWIWRYEDKHHTKEGLHLELKEQKPRKLVNNLCASDPLDLSGEVIGTEPKYLPEWLKEERKVLERDNTERNQ